MHEIVNKVLEVISLKCGHKLADIIKDCRMNNFINELEEIIQERYIKNYETEKYFHALDLFLAKNKFFNSVVENILSEVSEKSLNRICSNFVENFIAESSEFSPFKANIEQILINMANDIYRSCLQNRLLEKDSIIYIKMQTSLNSITDQIDTMGSDIKVIKDLMLSFQMEKTKERKCSKENHLELYKIYCDTTIDLQQKEIDYIIWISKNSDFKEGLVYLADNCKLLNDLKRAKKYYQYILQEYEAEEFELYNNLGLIELEEGDSEEAKKCFEKVLVHNNSSINALYNIAILLYCNENFTDAMEYIRKAYSVSPYDSDVASLYGGLLIEENINNCKQAIEIFEEALKQHSESFYLKINLGFAFLLSKRFKEGIDLLENLNNEYPDNILCISVLAMMYAMIGVEEAEKSIELFDKAYDLTGDLGYIRNTVHLKEGRFFDSITYNNKRYEIYTDKEVLRYYKNKAGKSFLEST